MRAIPRLEPEDLFPEIAEIGSPELRAAAIAGITAEDQAIEAKTERGLFAERPTVFLTREMVAVAIKLGPRARMQRTRAGLYDAEVGILGEFVFARWRHGSLYACNVGENIGRRDFREAEIKASLTPWRAGLHLFVREDYAAKRKPPAYVQVIVDGTQTRGIEPGARAILAGWASAEDVDAAPLVDPGAKGGGAAGFRVHALPLAALRGMRSFPRRTE